MEREMDPETQAELIVLAARMQDVSSRTYDLFFRAGMGSEVHAFIEFNGLISKYVDVCTKCANDGIDFRHLNTHTGKALPVANHDVAYIAEKLQCILGPIIDANPAARATLRRALFGDEL